MEPLTLLKTYFDALDRFDLDALLDCFGEDVVYGHPQVREWRPGRASPLLRGRDEVRQFMTEFRRKQQSRHRITGFGAGDVVRETDAVEGGPFYFATITGQNGRFVSSAHVAFAIGGDGRISHYSALSGPPHFNFQSSTRYLSSYKEHRPGADIWTGSNPPQEDCP